MYTYSKLAEYLGNKTDRPAPETANNTRVVRVDDSTIGITLHGHRIITVQADDRMILDSCGWRTVTTKQRMNEYLPYPWSVYQKNHIWYLSFMNWARDNVEYLFQDGITLDVDTQLVTRAGNLNAADDQKRLLKRARQYAKSYANEFTLGNILAPSAGDCWYCAWFIGSPDISHLVSHLDESYYVPSLLANAINEFPVSPIVGQCIHDVWYGEKHTIDGYFTDLAREQIEKSVKRYLMRRFEIA